MLLQGGKEGAETGKRFSKKEELFSKKGLTIPLECGIIYIVPIRSEQNMRVWRNWQTR